MNMPRINVAVGSLLIMQGIGFYVGTASKSVTALIPAFVGLPILVLGVLAYTVNPDCNVFLRGFSSGECEWRVASGGEEDVS